MVAPEMPQSQLDGRAEQPPTVVDIRRQLQRGKTTPESLVQAHIDNLRKHNRDLNAVVTVDEEGALRAARQQTAELAGGGPLPPLAGVPFTVKDSLHTEGMRTTFGSAAFADYVPEVDAPAVARLRHAGAILLGKCNCPEFAFGIHTWSPLHGHTRSPFPGLSPGGSSGGDAAAVVAGMAVFGVGSDFGGSLRWPAACTGLVAVRPTPGCIPSTGQYPPVGPSDPGTADQLSVQGRLQVIGPIARTVADAWLVTRIMAGADPSDSLSFPDPFAAICHPRPEQIRLGWTAGDGHFSPTRAVADAVLDTVDQLRSAGVRVTEFDSSLLAESVDLYDRLREVEDHWALKKSLEGRDHHLVSEATRILFGRAPVPRAVAAKLWYRRERLREAFLASIAEFDALLIPVSNRGPLTMLEAEDPQVLTAWRSLSYSRAVTLLGTPVVSLPAVPRESRGLIGLQVVTAPFQETRAVAIAHLIELIGGGEDTCDWPR